MTIKILVADDHEVFLQGLVSVVENHPSLTLIAEVMDGEQALKQIKELKPDIAILDISMPKMSGLEVAKKVRDLKLDVKLIFLTMYKEIDFYEEAIDLGVHGFVLKENSAEVLTDAIFTVHRGGHHKCPEIPKCMEEDNKSAIEHKLSKRGITLAERQVLKSLSKNKTNKQIASELGLHYRTIQSHRTNICKKLNFKGMNTLLKFAIEHKADLK